MQGNRRVSAVPQSRRQSTRLRKPSSKELDLLLLAGCSCLMTVLYHPVAHALQTHAAQNANSAIAAQTSTAKTSSTNAFHLIVPSKDEAKEEEES